MIKNKNEINLSAGSLLFAIALILAVGIFVGQITVFEALWYLFVVIVIVVGIPSAIIGILMLWAWLS